jgi:mRNA interferase YafQ
MYGVVRTHQFERSFRKLKKSGILKPSLKKEIDEVIITLASGKALPASYEDHGLSGDMSAYRDCHIRGDLLLIYELRHDKLILVLLNIGSHSQLFG